PTREGWLTTLRVVKLSSTDLTRPRSGKSSLVGFFGIALFFPRKQSCARCQSSSENSRGSWPYRSARCEPAGLIGSCVGPPIIAKNRHAAKGPESAGRNAKGPFACLPLGSTPSQASAPEMLSPEIRKPCSFGSERARVQIISVFQLAPSRHWFLSANRLPIVGHTDLNGASGQVESGRLVPGHWSVAGLK